MLYRAVGVFVLIALGFAVLLFPSMLAAPGGHQPAVLMFFGPILIFVALGLLLAPYFAAILERWRSTRWAAMLARVTHEFFLASAWGTLSLVVAFGMHLLGILSIWFLGQALGLGWPILDAAVLFTLMVGITLIPISIGRRGVREVAVSKLLRSHGISIEEWILCSLSSGIALLSASPPGALVWAIYSPRRPGRQVISTQ